jgi:membrane protease YdiL (CAAX protease family)
MTRFAPPFERFVAPARPRSELWRTALGVCLAAAIYTGATFGMLAVFQWLLGSQEISFQEPRTLLVFLATFIGMVAGVMLVTRVLHKRPIGSLFGRSAWVLRDFTLAVGAVVLVYGLAQILWLQMFEPLPGLAPGRWLAILPLALLLVLIQTGAEELAFRGYLQGQLAARFASPLVWALLPSLLFGLAHYDGSYPAPFPLVVVALTALFGLMMADLTARSGSLGAAWGLHFANNCAALLLISIDGDLSGLALYRTPYAMGDPVLLRLLWLDLASYGLVWLILRRLVAR